LHERNQIGLLHYLIGKEQKATSEGLTVMSSTCGRWTGSGEDEAHEVVKESSQRRVWQGRIPARASEELARVLLREALWLTEVKNGCTITEIARNEHLSRRQIFSGLARARRWEKALQPRDSRSREDLQGRDEPGDVNSGRGIEDQFRELPRLVPLFPIEAFTPNSACPHHGPIRSGSAFCCMVCEQSGMDDHPALKRDPRTDPRPERRAPAISSKAAGSHETRKQRRRRQQEAHRSGLAMARASGSRKAG
jgi:hypothetical protein